MDTTITTLKQTLTTVTDAVATAAPTLLATAIIVVVGLLVARSAKALMHWLLDRLQFERLAEVSGAANLLARARIDHSASAIVCTVVYWIVLAFTALAAMSSLGYADAATFAAIGAMVPKVIGAVVILAFGLNVAAFLATLVQAVAVNAEVRQGRLVRNGVFYAMTTLVAITALRTLGISADIVTNAFYILFAGTSLALAIAFGTGGKSLAASIAEGRWKSEQALSQDLSEASELGTAVFPSHSSGKPARAKARRPRRKAASAA